jgi:signal transduction histidine kinase
MKAISPRLAWQLFVAAILLLLGFAYFGLSRAQQYRESLEWVNHTLQVEAEVAALRADIAASSAARYQVPTDPKALARYAAASGAVEGVIDQLEKSTSDNGVQQANIAKLRPAVEQEMRAIAQGMPGAPDKAKDAAEATEVEMGDATNSVLQAMRAEEEQLLSTRMLISDRDRETLRTVLIAGMLTVLGIMIFAFRTIFVQLSLREAAERAVRKLSAHILRIQDAERRRLARELHDGVGQIFAGLSMELDTLSRTTKLDGKQKDCLDGASELAREGLTQTRTISYLLHPPMLEEFGLEQAATWYVEGFTNRSKIAVNLKFSQPFQRLPEALELVLFRVIQESLTNVSRHSGSDRADIAATLHPERVSLVIRDFGKGIPEDLLKGIEQSFSGAGVGLGGMRERVAELGGKLAIESNSQGTSITVSLPLLAEQEATAGGDSSARPLTNEVRRAEKPSRDFEGYSRAALEY